MTAAFRRMSLPGFKHDQVREEAQQPAPKGFLWVLLRRPSLWAVGMANFGLDFINFMFLTWYPSYLTTPIICRWAAWA